MGPWIYLDSKKGLLQYKYAQGELCLSYCQLLLYVYLITIKSISENVNSLLVATQTGHLKIFCLSESRHIHFQN